MAEKKTAGATRRPREGKGGVSAAERKRRAAQAQKDTGTPTLPTGESADEVRAAIEEARKANEEGRTLGGPEARGATVTSVAALRERAMGELIETPSGLTCRARRPGMIALLQSGTIPNALMPLVEKGLEAASKGVEVTQADIISDVTPDMMGDMVKLFDLVTMFVVMEPDLRPNPIGCTKCEWIDGIQDGQDHEHTPVALPERQWPTHHPKTNVELAYVGWVPMEDKQFLWNYAVGGTRDINRFRETQQATSLGSV